MAAWREIKMLKSIDKGTERVSSKYADHNISECTVASKGYKFGGRVSNVCTKTECINEKG